jgi:nicotinate-nucleotide adenylyltransferase
VERIGIFGGSFDPVHTAHLALAREAQQHLRLDTVLWVPVGQPWQKSRVLAPATHRAQMIRLAIADEPRFQLEPCELNRAGPSYTVDTVRLLAQRHPRAKLFLIIGQDQYANFDTWHEWEHILKYVRLAVANRAGETPMPPPAVAALKPHVRVVPLVPTSVSSTTVRSLVALGQEASSLVPDMLPAAVARYIDHHHLYQPQPTPC